LRLRMPQAGTDEAVARLDVDIERRRGDLAPARVEDARALPGLVRRLVAGEARVAMYPEQRAAHGPRIRTVLRAHLGDDRLQVSEQEQEGLAQVALVLGLVRMEPGTVVVPRQAAQDAKGSRGQAAGPASLP